MARALKTTRAVATVRTIEDIEAIEAQPYDTLVTARNLYDLFLATAEHIGERKALTVLRSADPADIGVQLTHRDLLAEITRAANMFHALGLRPGHGVAAFLMPTLPELPALLLGAQVAGIASALNYLLSPAAIADLLNAQDARVLVIPSRDLDETCWDKAAEVVPLVSSLTHVLVVGDDTGGMGGYTALSAHLSASNSEMLEFEPSSDPELVCAMFHTGGTTGRPKLVQLTHGNQIHAAFGFAQVFGHDENDTAINGLPFFHVGGTITVGLSNLAAGGHVVVPSPYALRQPKAVERLWDIAERFEATIVGGVPTSIGAITNSWTGRHDISNVRMAVTGGAICPAAVGQRFTEATGIRLFETYGMTETAAAIAFNPGRGEPLAGSVGFRAPFSQTRIVREAGGALHECAPGEAGLVQIKGPQVFPGYLDPAHNLGTLAEDGWLTTGDIGCLTGDQRLILTGREKDLIVRSGHNIDPAAIEDVANRFPGVEISAAVGMPDQYAGEVPALFVVPVSGARIDLDSLRDHLATHIHEPPALPRTILTIDDLPVTAVGKIFKPRLRDLAIEEKVRQEVSEICGSQAVAKVSIRLNDRKETEVDIVLGGAGADALDRLQAELAPLPQSYSVRLAEPVTLSITDGIATLTLCRPESLNALSRAMILALDEKLNEIADHPDIRAVILTGEGTAFCAGGDLIEFETALKAGRHVLLDQLRIGQKIINRIEELPMPVIAAVNGVAVAGGLELILCCDIVIAADGVKMGDGHAQYAVIPAAGASIRLHERLSPSHAAELFFTAGLVEAEKLADWGLVNDVVPADVLMDQARDMAARISRSSPEAVRRIKAMTSASVRTRPREARMAAEIENFVEHLEGKDFARGLAAFREKRLPDYE